MRVRGLKEGQASFLLMTLRRGLIDLPPDFIHNQLVDRIQKMHPLEGLIKAKGAILLVNLNQGRTRESFHLFNSLIDVIVASFHKFMIKLIVL